MLAAIRKTSAWPLPIQFACTLAVIAGAFFAEFPLKRKASAHLSHFSSPAFVLSPYCSAAHLAFSPWPSLLPWVRFSLSPSERLK